MAPGARAAWLTLAALTLAGAAAAQTAPVQTVPGQPLETRPPNATGQTPAFPGQTRAPYAPAGVAYEVSVVATGLESPWGLAFLPDGRLLVTERAGRLRIVAADGTLSPPVTGLPPIDVYGQQGLLDVALDPDFASNGLVYWAFTDPRPDGHGLAVARGRLVADGAPRLEDVKVIWRMKAGLVNGAYFGGRLAFARDKTLFIATGDGLISPKDGGSPEGAGQAQRLDSAIGKALRINRDGSIPKDNPFVHRKDALPELWSLGHRNIESAAINPWTGRLWTVEHGPKGGDELNIPLAGRNYGWPITTYGIDYSGKPVGAGLTAKAGMEQPVYYWDPVIAPSGMAFYDADLFPAWKGSLLVGSLREKHLTRLVLKGDRVVGEERLLVEVNERIRDVRVAPDGSVYLLTGTPAGRILKLTPKP
ncbi:MAG: glucose sorbosone dehydrogenase [Caulobacter sp.]|nr:glucose sorbosone dehydrogenase [Caulobacter sp.]